MRNSSAVTTILGRWGFHVGGVSGLKGEAERAGGEEGSYYEEGLGEQHFEGLFGEVAQGRRVFSGYPLTGGSE